MFKYTKAAIEKIKRDFEIGSTIFEGISLVLMITYFIVAIILGLGNLIINSILLSLIGAYFIFYSLNLKFNFSWFKTLIKRYYVISRLSLLALSLGISVYELYITSNHVNPVTIILTTLLIIFWLLQVVIELLKKIVINEATLFIEALEEDKKHALEPVKKIFQVKEEVKPKSKKILRLEKKLIKEQEKENKENKNHHWWNKIIK